MDGVTPVITKVVEVGNGSDTTEMLRQRHSPTWHGVSLAIFIGDTDGQRPYIEFMQVVVQPVEGVLDGHMQIPEGRGGQHLDATPDQGRGSVQLNAKTEGLRVGDGLEVGLHC